MNLREIKQSLLIQILNEAGYGTVLSEGKLRRHRKAFGDATGPANLFTYAAYLFHKLNVSDDKPTPSGLKRIDGQLETSWFRTQRRLAHNEMEKIPAVVNPERRKATQNDLLQFGYTYFPRLVFRDPQPYHRQFVKDFDTCVATGEKKAVLAPRGSGKTTWARIALLYAVLQHSDRHKYAMYIVASMAAATTSYHWMMQQFLENKLLKEDFPEVIYPILAYEENAARRVTHQGKLVNFKWSGKQIVLPTIEGAETSGVTILFKSIGSSGIRGADISIGDRTYRPSLVILDDIQTDQTAASEKSVDSMFNVLQKSLEYLPGFNEQTGQRNRLAVIAVLTAIAERDLASKLLDPEQSDYYGTIYRRLESLPVRMDLWKEYRKLCMRSKSQYGDLRLATDFFKTNRSEMERGAVCLDETDITEGCLSAIHSAMHQWAKNEAAFWTELQNDPAMATAVSQMGMVPHLILDKVNGLPEYEIPEWAKVMTAFIDVGEHYLNFEVVAYGEGFTGLHTMTIGFEPEQESGKVAKGSTDIIFLQEVYTQGTVRDRVRDAIYAALKRIWRLPYTRSGKPFDIRIPSPFVYARPGMEFPFPFLAAIGVDAGDGELETSVWSACNKFNLEFQPIAIPCYGGAARNRMFRHYPLLFQQGEWSRGTPFEHASWIENGKRSWKHLRQFGAVKRSLFYDSNIYKTARATAWKTSIESDGTHTIAQLASDHLNTYANHQCAEEPKTIKAYDGTLYDRWFERKPRFSDNEFLDTNTGCRALADYIGVEFSVQRERSDTPSHRSREEMRKILENRAKR